jgi:hypothetical protein
LSKETGARGADLPSAPGRLPGNPGPGHTWVQGYLGPLYNVPWHTRDRVYLVSAYAWDLVASGYMGPGYTHRGIPGAGYARVPG